MSRDDQARVEESRCNSDTSFGARSWDERMLDIGMRGVKVLMDVGNDEGASDEDDPGGDDQHAKDREDDFSGINLPSIDAGCKQHPAGCATQGVRSAHLMMQFATAARAW